MTSHRTRPAEWRGRRGRRNMASHRVSSGNRRHRVTGRVRIDVRHREGRRDLGRSKWGTSSSRAIRSLTRRSRAGSGSTRTLWRFAQGRLRPDGRQQRGPDRYPRGPAARSRHGVGPEERRHFAAGCRTRRADRGRAGRQDRGRSRVARDHSEMASRAGGISGTALLRDARHPGEDRRSGERGHSFVGWIKGAGLRPQQAHDALQLVPRGLKNTIEKLHDTADALGKIKENYAAAEERTSSPRSNGSRSSPKPPRKSTRSSDLPGEGRADGSRLDDHGQPGRHRRASG